ncbi:hypothetical protein IB276_35540 [Ensifer sp. ENS04]|uniref:hypothetical protein n=1 Tax=Ensifer sp. ENS04 TaxID=2769281 RepID=UPI0017851E2F|nr:hypothetical protein [Ensifer sp. ENS04]MBD9544747.1 hypothetical protein [Ensifer sp. ENS04]
MRDIEAGLKIRGAMLRLDALKPQGFTVDDLTAVSGASKETARDMLKPGRSRYTQQTGILRLSSGRPSKIYQLTEHGRQLLIQQVADARSHIAPPPRNERVRFDALNRLELTLAELDTTEVGSSEYYEYLDLAAIALKGCRGDLEELQKSDLPTADVSEYALRLGTAEGLLNGHQRHPLLSIPKVDPVDWLVRNYGRWSHMPKSPIEPVLVLFDGIDGHDALSERVLARCEANEVSVASFNMSAMDQKRRRALFTWIDCLRKTTPLAASNFVLTVNGHTPIGKTLAREFNLFSKSDVNEKGKYGHKAKLPLDFPGFIEEEYKTIRQSYIERLAFAIHSANDARRQAFAAKCSSLLTTFTAAEAVKGASLADARLQHQRTALLHAAHQMMGAHLCIDVGFTKSVERTFQGDDVRYIAAMELVDVDAEMLSYAAI